MIRLPLLAVLFSGMLFLVSYQATNAFFTSNAASTGNTFSAASEFPPITSAQGNVILNEINWGGSSSSSADEWIEIRNMTGNTFDLTGWQLIGAGNSDITIPSGTLSPNGFFLIANFDQNSLSSVLNIAPDYVTSALQIDNANMQIFLVNEASDIVSIADDGVGVPFKGSTSPRRSMERKDPPGSNGMDPINWQDATTSANLDVSTPDFGTPKAANGI